MFNEETCTRCGECLSECPFMEMKVDLAQEEIGQAIDERHSDAIINGCAACGQCNAICPTDSNPLALMHEILLKNNKEEGVAGLFLISEDVPSNLFNMALDVATGEKKSILEKYSNPPGNNEMFYAGCALPQIFPDLTKTSLMEAYPVVGGMKYCCGGTVFGSFGEEEARIRGAKLFEEFKKLGIKKLITMCPGCNALLGGVYPNLINGFDIECRTFTDYLVEKQRSGELDFSKKIEKKIAFHDSCLSRGQGPEVYDSPREFLKSIGAEVVEMEHNRENSLCCGFPLSSKVPPPLSEKIAERRVSEAIEQGAEAIAVNCVGCLNLSPKAAEMGVDTFHVIELAQMAIGETPPHRINETLGNTMGSVMKRVEEKPSIMTDRYISRGGQIEKL